MKKEEESRVQVLEPETAVQEKVETKKASKPKAEKATLNLDNPIEVDKAEVNATEKDDDTRGKVAKFLNLKKIEKKEISEDAKKNRKWAWTAYILFFIPLLINKNSKFMRLHANEGLDVNIIDLSAIILMLVGKLITGTTILGKSILMASFLIGLGLIFMTTITKIVMIICSALGRDHQTPWLWKTRLIKDLPEEEKKEEK